ncbi:AT-rich interactive domain-containing protein 6-like [Phragmites australis]|uniref:AT-rich interactive domain-containing protein 6-like n=1 Tax=Phragmites australis TaxID=29695 RepID=UPI002D7872D9|nr:AT-rich interactive domain-containing protein 6-like [Phragmites australis]
MPQEEGGGEASPQVEGEAQPPADVPVDEAMAVEEDKSVIGEGGPTEAAGTVDSVKGSANAEGAGAEGSGEERNGDAAVDLAGEAEKLENGDGRAKVEGEKGGSPEEGGGSDGDNKGVDGQNQPAENQLVLVPAEEDLAPSKISNNSFMFDYTSGGDDSGTEDEQAAFMKELELFYREKMMEFKPPKFYGEGLNCLKLWRQVTGLGGYDQVTSCKLWRQVGESFKPPKTCTTVSWTFRNFYEKALLEYEKHKIATGEFQVAASTLTERIASENQVGGSHASGSGRARRESATRAMQGWHSQRLLGNGEIADPLIKDKGAIVIKKDKIPKSSGSAKRKRTPTLDDDRVVPYKSDKLQNDSMVTDMGPPADWVKINVRRTKDCYEVYALVPGLLREEVHVQSDPAGRLIVTGEPEQLDNPWGVTPFKKVISLPSRIDPHQTSAVVTLHGQLFVRAPFEQSK